MKISWANFIVYIFTLIQILQGVILALFRLSEPVYFSMIKLEMNSWLGDLDEESAKKIGVESSQSAFSQMITQLCTDLTYTILDTVTTNLVGTPKLEKDYPIYLGYDYKNRNDT